VSPYPLLPPGSTSELPEEEQDELVLFIAMQTGFTRKLRGLVVWQGGVARVQVFADDPYKHGMDLAGDGAYNTAVLWLARQALCGRGWYLMLLGEYYLGE